MNAANLVLNLEEMHLNDKGFNSIALFLLFTLTFNVS